jgi:hypothetical protein
MSRIIIVALISLFANTMCCFAQGAKTDLEYEHLRGRVKSVRVQTYSLQKQEDGSIKRIDFYDCEEFDFGDYEIELSNRNRIRAYPLWGIYCENYFKKYDTNGNIVENILWGDSSDSQHYVCSSDEKGRVLSWINKTDSTESKYKYDNKDNIVEIIDYDSSKISLNYKDNNLIEMVSQSNNSKDKEKYLYRYDDKNRLIEYKSMDLDSAGRIVIVAFNFYKYNNRNQVIEERSKFDSEYNYLYQCTYDDKGNKTTNAIDILHKKVKPRISIEEYDQYGNLVNFQDDRTKENNQYEYDSYGNWIKQTTTDIHIIKEDEDFPLITERKIEYYE